MDTADLLVAELREMGHLVPVAAMKAALERASLTLTGGARQAAEAHLKRHLNLSGLTD